MIYEMLKVQTSLLGPSALLYLGIAGIAIQIGKKKHEAIYWGSIFGIALGYLLAHWRIEGIPVISSQETLPYFAMQQSWHGLFFLSFFALLSGWICSFSSFRYQWAVPLAIALSIASGAILVPSWQEKARYWQFGIGVSYLILWFFLHYSSEKQSPFVFTFLCFFWSFASSLVLLQAGIAKFAQLCGVLTMFSGFTLVIQWRFPLFYFSRGAAICFPLFITGLLCNGYFNHYSDVPLSSFLGVLFAPLLSLFGILPFIQKKNPWKKAIASFGLFFPALFYLVFIAFQAGSTSPY